MAVHGILSWDRNRKLAKHGAIAFCLGFVVFFMHWDLIHSIVSAPLCDLVAGPGNKCIHYVQMPYRPGFLFAVESGLFGGTLFLVPVLVGHLASQLISDRQPSEAYLPVRAALWSLAAMVTGIGAGYLFVLFRIAPGFASQSALVHL